MKKMKDWSVKEKLGVPAINSSEFLVARDKECELPR